MTERSTTSRGFAVYDEFTDTYGSEIRVQQSSSAESPRVWIFTSHASPRGHLSRDVAARIAAAGFGTDLHLAELGAMLEPSPHLDVEGARRMVTALNQFIAEHEAREDGGQ